MKATGVGEGSAVTALGWALLQHLAAALLGQALQLLPVHPAIAIAVGVAEVAPQPAVGLRLAPVDAAVAVAVDPAEEALGPLSTCSGCRRQIRRHEEAPPLPVQPFEMPLEIRLTVDLPALQSPVAIAIEADEQLLQPLLVTLLLRWCLGVHAAGTAQGEQPGCDRCPAALVACRSPHASRLWSAPHAGVAHDAVNL